MGNQNKSLNLYDESLIECNIYHELNKMLVSISADFDEKIQNIRQNGSPHYPKDEINRLSYYLSFSLKTREHMAGILDISEKTLHRIYQNPLKLLDDHRVSIRIAQFFELSYAQLMARIFNQTTSLNTTSTDSPFIKLIMDIEKNYSVEDRRALSRILSLIVSLKIPINEFFSLNNKLIKTKGYLKDNYNRISSFLDNI